MALVIIEEEQLLVILEKNRLATIKDVERIIDSKIDKNKESNWIGRIEAQRWAKRARYADFRQFIIENDVQTQSPNGRTILYNKQQIIDAVNKQAA